MIDRNGSRTVAVGIAALAIAAACGTGGTAGATASTAAAGGGGTASGEVKVTGSSTVQPISQAVSEAFADANPDFGYVVEGPGTGDGFDDFFCTGEYEVADASRAIDEEEAAACEEAGVEYVELKVAYDGITVFTSPDTELECLTLPDLYALFGPESSDFATWEDAAALAEELGSSTQFPTGNLSITAPGEESGTYSSFIELALGDLIEERGQEEALGTHYTPSPDDNVIVENVAGTPNSLGFAGFSFYEANQERLKAVQVDTGEGCASPTAETISDGSYGLSRPLFIYPSLTKAADNPALVAWVDYYLSDEGTANVANTGYVELPAEELEATRQAWSDAKP